MQSAQKRHPGRAGRAALFLLPALFACHKDAAVASAPPRPAYLEGVPALSFARLVDTSGTSEADRRTYLTVLTIDSTRRFYRDTLPKTGWSIMSDAGDRTKADLYSQKGELRLWVHVEPVVIDGVMGTKLMLIGTRDTTRVPSDSTP